MESQRNFHFSDKEDLSVNAQILHCEGSLQDFSDYTLNVKQNELKPRV